MIKKTEEEKTYVKSINRNGDIEINGDRHASAIVHFNVFDQSVLFFFIKNQRRHDQMIFGIR